jgi:hypothetical protein
LKNSDALKIAKEKLVMEVPTSFYQYERDFKGFKDDKEKKIQYLMNIKAENVQQIFKNDLEADTMLSMFSTFLE